MQQFKDVLYKYTIPFVVNNTYFQIEVYLFTVSLISVISMRTVFKSDHSQALQGSDRTTPFKGLCDKYQPGE